MNTEMNHSVSITEGTARYDIDAKRLIGHRSILGHVVVNAIESCHGMNPEEAAELIEGDVYIGSVPVDPGLTNVMDRGARVIGLNTESGEVNEGMVRYDLLFYMQLPDGLAQVIVNIEVQGENPTDYALLNRGIYYACRGVSSQKDREFTGQNYDNIKSVYSVWICMNAHKNSLTDYHLTGDLLLGGVRWPGNLDMIHVVMIGITEKVPAAGNANRLHRLLCALLSNELSREERMNILEQEYHLPATVMNGEEANEMCNLGEVLVEKTYNKATAEYVTKMFSKNCAPEQIAELLDLSLDKVMAILTGQGLIQA